MLQDLPRRNKGSLLTASGALVRRFTLLLVREFSVSTTTSKSGLMNNVNQQKFPLPNNNLGIQAHSPLGPGNIQNMNPFMPNMQPMINPHQFMHAANNFHPLQNNQLVPPHLALAGQQNGVGNMNCNPLFQVQGRNMRSGGQFNLSQAQAQILAQNIVNLLQQSNTNMQNGRAPLPLQNMNQELPMQVSNQDQVHPYGIAPGSHPMCNFPNQGPQAMVPQNPFSSPNMQFNNVRGNQMPQAMVPQNPFPSTNMQFNNVIGNQVPQAMVPHIPFSSANLPLNHMPGNQVRPQFNQVGPQLEGNTRAPPNPNSLKQVQAKHYQPVFTNSQEKPMNNVKAYVPNPNWKGSPNKNLKNNPNRGRFQGGCRFQKSKFHGLNKGKKKFGASKEHHHKGLNGGNSGMEQNMVQKRSRPVKYTDKEIHQWREARRMNYPSKDNIQKMGHQGGLKIADKKVLRRELKQILARQAELGVEVAEIPSEYLNDSTTKRKFRNRSDKRTGRNDRHSKKQKLADEDLSQDPPSSGNRSPTLLQKLLSADIKRDRSHLLQAFRFMVINSFFQDPDKPIGYPYVKVKENGYECGDQDLASLVCDSHGDTIEDGDCDDKNVRQVNPQEECLDEESEKSEEFEESEGSEKSEVSEESEEEGEILG